MSTDLTGGTELRRLKVIGIVLPVLFIVAVESVRLVAVEGMRPHRGHLILGALVVVAVVAFGITMFCYIDRTHRLIVRRNRELADVSIQHAQLIADLQRRKREGHALYDLLLQISGQEAPMATLASITGTARDLLGADDAVLCLRRSTSTFVSLDSLDSLDALGGAPAGAQAGAPPAGGRADGLVCVSAEGAFVCGTRETECPIRSSTRDGAAVSAPLRGPAEPLGELWLGRRADTAFGGRDESFLGTLSELAVLALAHARTLENERHGATLAERERIAREMHDSLAQVLGVAHLRLCALAVRPQVKDAPEVEAELADLAGITQEAYRDVREAILGLHESSRTDRALLEGLRAYVEKFSRQSGVATTLDSALDDDLTLAPRCEVQVIRVIQEALTNVRKHSGARSAAVRVTGTPDLTTFVVEDDGHGFDLSAVPADRDGFGLHSMRERMRLVSGTLTIDSAPGRGTRVIVRVPGPGRVHVRQPLTHEAGGT